MPAVRFYGGPMDGELRQLPEGKCQFEVMVLDERSQGDRAAGLMPGVSAGHYRRPDTVVISGAMPEIWAWHPPRRC